MPDSRPVSLLAVLVLPALLLAQKPGTEERTFKVGDTEREYLLHIPRGFKKSEKKGGVRTGKAWQRRWFVLEVETEAGTDENTIVKKARLVYYHSDKDAKQGGEAVEIPLNETMGVKAGLGKTPDGFGGTARHRPLRRRRTRASLAT